MKGILKKGVFIMRFAYIQFLCICLLCPLVMGEKNQECVESILKGIIHKSEQLKTISFNYSVEYHYSEQWRKKKESRAPKFLKRVPFVEETMRAGVFVRDRDKDAFKITNRVYATADEFVFIDKSFFSDGVKVTEIDPRSNIAKITPAKEFTRSDISFFPDKYQNLFLDGVDIQNLYNSGKVVFSYIGQQEYDGIQCEMLEISRSYKTPEGLEKFTKDRVWIAQEKGYLIIHGISFETDPNQPINSITTKVKENSDEIWHYSEVLFESFPLNNEEPDVRQHLKLKDIKINEKLSNEVFIPDLSGMKDVLKSDNLP